LRVDQSSESHAPSTLFSLGRAPAGRDHGFSGSRNAPAGLLRDMGQGMVLSVPRHPHWAIQLAGIDGKLASIDGKVAGIDGKLASIDGKVAGIDGKLASIDGKVAGIDGKLASCAPSTETVRRLGSTRIGRSPFKPETWGPRTRHMRSSVRRPRLPCSTPYETWSGDRAAVKKTRRRPASAPTPTCCPTERARRRRSSAAHGSQ
jgi:hypothetical protein